MTPPPGSPEVSAAHTGSPLIDAAVRATGMHRWPGRRFVVPSWNAPGSEAITCELGWLPAPDPEEGGDWPCLTEVMLCQGSATGRLKVVVPGGFTVMVSRPTETETRALLSLCPTRITRQRWLHAPSSHGGSFEEGRWYIDRLTTSAGHLDTARIEGPPPTRYPGFLGQEVTHDPRYRAAWVARYGLPPHGPAPARHGGTRQR